MSVIVASTELRLELGCASNARSLGAPPFAESAGPPSSTDDVESSGLPAACSPSRGGPSRNATAAPTASTAPTRPAAIIHVVRDMLKSISLSCGKFKIVVEAARYALAISCLKESGQQFKLGLERGDSLLKFSHSFDGTAAHVGGLLNFRLLNRRLLRTQEF